MNLKQALLCDFNNEDQVKEFNVFLSKIKWLEGKELTLENFEKLVRVIKKKYKVRISYICPASELSYGFMIRNDVNNTWIKTIYATSIYEGFAKSIIVMYAHAVKGVVFKHEQ